MNFGMHTGDFEKIHKLGAQSNRKFNAVFLVKHKENGISGVYKQLIKTEKNQHLWSLLRQETELSFAERELPQTLAFHENEREIILIRNFKEGVPLSEYWKQIPKKGKLDFLIQLIEKLIPAFDVLRQNRIVHCDIKPSNIIVSHVNNELQVSLIDFGMAVLADKPEERKTLFALGYSAPELILNKLDLVNQATDIFSLGICLWQLFAGKLPLMHPNPGIMTNLQITHPLPENSSIPRGIYKVLEKMCFKHSFQLPPNHMKDEEVEIFLRSAMDKRFQNLEEVRDALRGVQPETGFLAKIRNKFK